MVRRALSVALCWLLAGQPAWAACIKQETARIDIAAIHDTNITIAGYSTALSNQIILAVPMNWRSTTFSAVTSVTDTAGLVWSRRGPAHQMNSSSCFGVGSPCLVDIEVWWARTASPLVGDAITANWGSAVEVGAMFVVAYDGVQAPVWDINGSLPTPNSNAAGASSLPSVAGVSTSYPVTQLLAFCEWTAVPGAFCSAPSGFTGVASADNYQPFNARYMATQLADMAVSSPQSSITLTATGAPTLSWFMFADALVCDAVPPPVTSGYPNTWVHE